MRVFALSDIHVDYDVNAKWVADLSIAEYQDDALITYSHFLPRFRLSEGNLDNVEAPDAHP
jgi:hypothetical protein